MNTYEKKYIEALERAKTLYDNANGMILKKWVEQVFPELKENEDEKIRKELIDYINRLTASPNYIDKYNAWIAWLEKQGDKEYALKSSKHEDVLKFVQYIEKEAKAYDLNLPHRGYDIYAFAKDILAWLEKQGEKEQDPCENCKDKCLNCHNFPCVDKREFEQGKSAMEAINEENVDNAIKVEPKFKVGDFIKHNKANIICKVISVNSGSYYVENIDTSGRIELFNAEQNFHLWTIQDAKDGDVLATENFIFIFKNIDNDNGVHYYCQYEISKHEDDNQFDVALPQSLMGRVGNSIIHYSPATKEQRDLLFQKMKESGYEWDDKKKELRRIKSKVSKIIKSKNYFCIKTHNYAGIEWIKGTKYYASDNYTLVNQGCEYYCPEYSKEEHNNLFEEVKYDDCVEKQGEQKPVIDIDIPFGAKDSELIEASYYIPEGFHAEIEGNNVVIKKGEQKQKWGDDDEQYLLVCKNALRKYQVSDKWDADIISKWLEDKLKQGKQGEKTSKWTEEDERFLNDVDFTLFQYKDMSKEKYWEIINWLRTIKQRMEEQQ